MPAVKTGMTPPPMPGMPAPMQPMGGMPPAPGMPSAPPPNPFAPMPPMPLAGGPPPQMPPMSQVQGQQMQGSTAGRRRRFGDALEGMLGRNQGLGASMPQPQSAMPPQMMPQQRMVAPGTPMMRTPPMQSMAPRPMAMGGEVDIFGYADGGPVQYFEDGGPPVLGEGIGSMDEYYDLVKESSSSGLGSGSDLNVVRSGERYKVVDSSGNPVSFNALFGRDDLDPTVQAGYGSISAAKSAIEGQGFDYMGEARSGYSSDPARESMVRSNLLNAGYEDLGDGRYRSTRGAVMDMADIMNYRFGDNVLNWEGSDETGWTPVRVYVGEYEAPSQASVSVDKVTSAPVSTITGAQAGAGSAVGAGGNFGTGSYTAAPVDPSEVNEIDYSQFTGDVGRTTGGYDTVDPETGVVTLGTREQAALFGPKVNIPTSVSQYMTDPITGGLTTSYGPEMVATSPIGAIKLPARPVEIDIFDFLSTPTYGTMYSGIAPIDTGDVDLYGYGDVNNMRMGGEVSGPFGGDSVPRSTMIADQPHMLAYINQDEEALLRSFGGSGISGPAGIPSYPPESVISRDYAEINKVRDSLKDMAKSDNDDSSSIGPSGNVSLDAIANAAVQADDNTSFSYGGNTFDNVADYHDAIFGGDDDSSSVNTSAKDADLGVGGSDKTVTVADLTSGTGTTTYDTGGGNVTVATGSSIDDILNTASSGNAGSSVISVIDPVSAPVYTDRRGNQHDSQAAADTADRAFAAQLRLYGSGQQGIDSFSATARESGIFDSPEQANRAAARAYPTYLQNYPEGREINIFDPSPITYSDIAGVGGLPPLGDTRGGVLGVQPITSMNDPDITQFLPASSRGIETYGIDDNILDLNVSKAGRNLDADMDPFDRDRVTNVPLTDDDMGLPSGPVSDLERGLGAPSTVQDFAPPEAGYTSLSEIKNRISRAEGTADEGGYGRLLGGQEGRFGVDLTNMTVQEVLDFQNLRGKDSYAAYSQGVNTQRGMTRADGSGVISTPAGKYQVVGSTLQSLVDQGIVDPNAKFDEGTQERIGTHLVMNDLAGGKGLSDLKSGKLTPEEFEAALGKQFEGISRGLDKGAGSTALTIGAASETGRQVEQGRRDDNVEKIKQQIGDQAEPTGIESIFYDVIGGLGFGLGKPLADKLRGSSRENRQAIIDQHVYALQNGATPKTDEDGNYIGFDISTMDTFADKVLAADDIMAFMPPSSEASSFTVTQDMIDSLRGSGLNAQADALTVGQTLSLPAYSNPAYKADADGDGVSDYDRFQQVFGAQSTAASADPTGMSTEQGFITSDGKEFFVDAGGNVVEITDGTVPLEVGGGQNVAEALGVTETTTGGDDGSEEIKNYTTDDDGNKVCNDEGYVYNSDTDMCEPPAEEEKSDTVSSPIGIGIPSSRRFDDIMARITTRAPKIAPISANIRPMQDGGMAGLNRTADNFLKALAG